MEDAAFLADAFKGADIVYAMEAMAANSFMDKDLDLMAAISHIGNCYKNGHRTVRSEKSSAPQQHRRTH